MQQANQILNHDDPSVLKHMEMYQSIITRMANNSAACKKWCIPFVTAILAYVVTQPELRVPNIQVLVIAPIFVFYFLDAYYLKLENQFRNGFNESASEIRAHQFGTEQLFQLLPKGGEVQFWLKAVTSPSTWPVYLGMLTLVALANFLVIA